MPEQSERDLQTDVTKALHGLGWLTEHSYRLKTSDGHWRTGNTLVGKPDLMALRPPRMLAIELKAEAGVVDKRQRALLSIYSLVPCCRAWVIRPSDWDRFRGWIRRPAEAPAAWGFEPMGQLEAYRVVAPASVRRTR